MTNSHIIVHKFEYLEPATLEEAISLLEQYGDRARVLAGGTDLLVQMKMERLKPTHLISINEIPGLDGIAVQGDELHIGTRTSIRAIRNAPYIRAHYPALAEACASFSTTQIQIMGTIGGNLCNGSPASDAAPALIAYGAEVMLRGTDGERRLPLEEFFVGPGKTVLQKGELLTAVVLPETSEVSGGAFLKITRVAADLAKANGAVVLARNGERIVDCRVAFGAVAPTPLRAKNTETLLRGQTFSAELVEKAAQTAAEEIAPIDDVRSTAEYRHQVVRAMAIDGLNAAWERAGSGQMSKWANESTKDTKAHKEANEQTGERGGKDFTPTVHVGVEGKRPITLMVNGRKHRLHVAPNELLLNVIRDRLGLTGVKYGCGIGECGACTVLVDSEPVLACLVLALSADGHGIVTVEGLQGADGKLDPLQEAFIDNAAFQCGYCTPGMLMTAKALLREIPHPPEEEVRDYVKGNLCRCTGYASIVRAIMDCAEGQLPEVRP